MPLKKRPEKQLEIDFALVHSFLNQGQKIVIPISAGFVNTEFIFGLLVKRILSY